MMVTLEGIVTLARLLWSQNALLAMLVTGFPLMVGGMSIAPTGSVTTPVIVITVPESEYLKLPDVPDVDAESDAVAQANPSQIANRQSDEARCRRNRWATCRKIPGADP